MEIKTLDIRDDRRNDNRINRRSFDRTVFASKSVIIWAGGENFVSLRIIIALKCKKNEIECNCVFKMELQINFDLGIWDQNNFAI